MSISITPRASRRIARPATNNPSPLVKRRTRAALCFLLPGLALFTVFVIYPIASSIVLSFHHWDGMTAKTFAGLDNYRELIASDTFYTALKNNLTWLALFLLAPPAGLALALYTPPASVSLNTLATPGFGAFLHGIGLHLGWPTGRSPR